MSRLFTAVTPPESVRQQLAGLCGGVPGARWQDPERMHITLRFIGEVDATAFVEIRDALSDVEAPSFSLMLEGVGCFPLRGPARVLWVGVTLDPALARLRRRTDSALAHVGYGPESRNFSPHVTIARFAARAPARRLREFLAWHGGFRAGPFPVCSFALMSSSLGEDGPHYTTEARYPLLDAGERL